MIETIIKEGEFCNGLRFEILGSENFDYFPERITLKIILYFTYKRCPVSKKLLNLYVLNLVTLVPFI